MGLYSILKDSIKQVIKPNSRRAITGSLLQSQLLTIIDSLGTGYQYMGIASPNQDLGTPDQKVFYFTAAPGTYMGIDVTGFGILSYDTEWCFTLLHIGGSQIFEAIYGETSFDEVRTAIRAGLMVYLIHTGAEGYKRTFIPGVLNDTTSPGYIRFYSMSFPSGSYSIFEITLRSDDGWRFDGETRLVAEAPNDGRTYGRRSGSWVALNL